MNSLSPHTEVAKLVSDDMVKIANKQRLQDFFFFRVTQSFSLLVLLALLGIIISLFINAWPTFHKFGLQFIWRVEWDIIKNDFGAAIAVVGQVPVKALLGGMPLIGSLFGGATNGMGILAAGVVLAFMVLPFVAAVMRDVFEITPAILRESAYGLGCTTWEVVRKVVLPYTQKGVIGGVMLGLGRALGETMAVTFVIGNANRMPTSLFSPGTSIASVLANEFGEAEGLHFSTLFALGFLLFVITFVVLATAKAMINRAEKAKGS